MIIQWFLYALERKKPSPVSLAELLLPSQAMTLWDAAAVGAQMHLYLPPLVLLCQQVSVSSSANASCWLVNKRRVTQNKGTAGTGKREIHSSGSYIQVYVTSNTTKGCSYTPATVALSKK